MSWRRLLSAAVVTALIGGAAAFGGVTPGNAATGVVHQETIPASSFIPTSNSVDHTNDGINIRVHSGIAGYFVAPLSFPVDLDRVRINRVTFRYLDEGPLDMCFRVYRAQPKHGTAVQAGEKCTSGQDIAPRGLAIRRVKPSGGTPATAFHLWVSIPAGSLTYRFLGATVEWEEI